MESADKSGWYTLQVMSGQENRVKTLLEAHQQRGLEDGIDHGVLEVLIPSQKVRERRDNKILTRDVKMFPGYVFIHALICDETGKVIPENWLFVKETQGVINFMGGEHPISLSEQEVAGLMQFEEEKNAPQEEPTWKVGEKVIIKAGSFEGSEGTIEGVDASRQRLNVSVYLFGRLTPCELEFWQVDRIQ